MLETKSISVAPDGENYAIKLWANFGWELKSSQEINNTDSHLERRGDEIVSVTTKENYVKLVFSRDTKMPNYDRIHELEQNYVAILAAEPTPPSGASPILTLILLVFYIAPGVLYLVYKSKKRKKWQAEQYDPWQKKLDTEGKKILAEAASLL